jgi:hypothetical protein
LVRDEDIDFADAAGAIKIVSFHKGLERVQPGLVGYTRLTFVKTRLWLSPAFEVKTEPEEVGRVYAPLFPVPEGGA